MRKIPTLFRRDPANMARLLPEIHPDCQWVMDGEGVATRKIDGMCCAIVDGVFVKRRELKKGKPAPDGFIQAQVDDVTGKTVGWVPIGDGPDDKYFREAFAALPESMMIDQTFEFVGPKSQGGIEGYETHQLVAHNSPELIIEGGASIPRDFEWLGQWLADKPIEGIVWHHEDGQRMAKIKGRDYGHKRPRP